MIWLAVALGGAAGSVLRYGAGRLAINYWGPTTVMATFAVNVSGSFALGVFYTLAAERTTLPVEIRALIIPVLVATRVRLAWRPEVAERGSWPGAAPGDATTCFGEVLTFLEGPGLLQERLLRIHRNPFGS